MPNEVFKVNDVVQVINEETGWVDCICVVDNADSTSKVRCYMTVPNYGTPGFNGRQIPIFFMNTDIMKIGEIRLKVFDNE